MVDLASLVIGGLLTLAGTVYVEKFKKGEDRRGIASAIAGEISAVLHGSEKRDQISGFTSMMIALRCPNPPPRPWVWVDADYVRDPILNAYIDKIGTLGGDFPERVARFYTVLDILRADLKRIHGPEFEHQPLAAADLIEADLKIWNETSTDAKKLVNDLQQLAKGWF